MTGLIVGLVLAVIALCLVISLLAYEIIHGNDRLEADHAMCVAHTADVSSRRILAMYARELARRFDAVEEKGTLMEIRRRYKPEGASVMALWLLVQAEQIDPANDEVDDDD